MTTKNLRWYLSIVIAEGLIGVALLVLGIVFKNGSVIAFSSGVIILLPLFIWLEKKVKDNTRRIYEYY